MPIPDFQSLMLPIMKIAQDGEEHTMREVRQRIGDDLGLSDAERKQLLPSGSQPVFTNRIAWARAHLLMACMLSKTGRGSFRISRRGQEVLASNPSSINMRFLQQFPEYVAARNLPKRKVPQEEPPGGDTASPQERIELAFRELNHSLTTELRSKLETIDPFRFEQVVLDLLLKMGYGGSKKEAAQVTKRTGDEGIDGLINEDRLGLRSFTSKQSTGNIESVALKFRVSSVRLRERKLGKEYSSQPVTFTITHVSTLRACTRNSC
jgi:restriction system protein